MDRILDLVDRAAPRAEIVDAPNYAEKRRSLAKQIGLGRKPTKPTAKRKTNGKKAS